MFTMDESGKNLTKKGQERGKKKEIYAGIDDFLAVGTLGKRKRENEEDQN